MNSLPGFRCWIAASLMSMAWVAAAQSSDGVIGGEPLAQVPRQHPQQPLEGGMTIVPQDVGTLRLGPGMQLRFGVYDTPEMTATLRVSADGFVPVPLAGPVKVERMTLPEARRAIEAALVKGEYFVKPQVTLDVVQIAPGYLTMVGEVQAPGRFQILAPITLQAAMAQAGGETADAGAMIDIHRDGIHKDGTPMDERLPNERSDQSRFGAVMVGPGDTVNVNRAGIVYVLGAVHRPGGYLMLNRGSLNVLEALALSQGTLLEAATGSIRILHRQGEQLTEERFRLDPSTKGTSTPPLLHDTDIVYVPASKPKSIVVNGAAIIGAATSSIIYRVY